MLAIVKSFSRKKALILVSAAALVLLLLILLRGAVRGSGGLQTTQQRTAYLAELGWQVDPYSEETKSVRIPDCSEGVMAEYDRLQHSQGFDLGAHAGERCVQYSYVVTNYPGYDQTVYATIYLQRGRLIAGDIHTAAVNGFMHALVRDGSSPE